MPTYKFEAMDTAGGEVKDAVDAPSEEEAQQKIKQMGYFVTKIQEIQQRIPSPVNPAGLRAYVSSMSTDPLWRRRGMARAVMNHVLDLLRERGVPEVTLHATESGRPLYASFGFYRRDREMVRPLW